MTILLLSSTLGVLFGYIMTTQFIGKLEWQYAFYVQIIAVIPIVIAILLTPLKYLDLQLASMIKAGIKPDEQPDERVDEGKSYTPVKTSQTPSSRKLSLGNDAEFFNHKRHKSHSLDKFGFQGDIARMFTDEKAPTAHLSMTE